MARPLWSPAGSRVPLADVPDVEADGLAAACADLKAGGARLVAMLPLAAAPAREVLDVLVVFADDAANRVGMLRARFRPGAPYPAVTASLPEAQAYERELWEDHGVVPAGHPWLKPLRRHPELGGAEPDPKRPVAAHPFFRVDGPGVHEVAVGPVHAGIIEPGHFRLQCRGEEVLSLEIHLGYQFRDAERALVAGTPARRLAIAESVAGDGAVGHALAHCLAVEGLADIEVPLAAQVVRGIALELERIAAHVGDLGALAGDVGYLPAAAWFGRLRGEVLNLLMEVSGSRFGRGLVVPGGVRFGIGAAARGALVERLGPVERDARAAATVLFDAASVLSRFEGTGVVTRDAAEALGLVGPVARASGVSRDARRDHPHGIYRFAIIPVSAGDSGDVMARAMVRWLEVQRSLVFVREQLAELREGPWAVPVPPPSPAAVVATVVEGWRGEIVHVAATAADATLAGYRIVDPSFHNWFGLTMAMRGNAVSDFPLCNKSYNLSYAGHDR